MPSGMVTTTSLKEPAASAGTVAVIWLKLVTVTFVAGCPPMVTVAAPSKSVPAIVTAVPLAGGRDAGLIENGSRCEDSDVLPFACVAVLERRSPGPLEARRGTSGGRSPGASGGRGPEPRYVRPSRKSFGNRTHGSLEKKSTAKLEAGAPWRKPWTRVPPVCRPGPGCTSVTTDRTGKFWSRF